MKFLSAFLFCSTLSAATLNILHYNIKELDSKKLRSKSDQFNYVQRVINKLTKKSDFDLISINEIQYDLPGVPTKKYKTKGQNLEILREKLNLSSSYQATLHPANTGENAQTLPNGDYHISPAEPGARDRADQLNFGIFPSQYSTGLLHKPIKVSEAVIKDLKWKDVFPERNFEAFRTAKGEKFPDDMKLFDKNFTDITLSVEGKQVHVILLHTVPAYGFGNPKSINIVRNADQLRFLEWYLTGSTDMNTDPKLKISHLSKNDTFIALGDFNVDDIDTKKEGSFVLKRILRKTKPWMSPTPFTHYGSRFERREHGMGLDYILLSKNVKIHSSGVHYPLSRWKDLGCDPKSASKKKRGFQRIEYKKGCFALVDIDHFNAKKASDHMAVWTKVEL